MENSVTKSVLIRLALYIKDKHIIDNQRRYIEIYVTELQRKKAKDKSVPVSRYVLPHLRVSGLSARKWLIERVSYLANAELMLAI